MNNNEELNRVNDLLREFVLLNNIPSAIVQSKKNVCNRSIELFACGVDSNSKRDAAMRKLNECLSKNPGYEFTATVDRDTF